MQVSRKESDKASSFLPANKRSKEPQICHDDIEGEVELNSRGLGMGRVYTHQQMYPQIRLYYILFTYLTTIQKNNDCTSKYNYYIQTTIQSILARGGSGLVELFFITFY